LRKTAFLTALFLMASWRGISYSHPLDEARVWHTMMITISDEEITIDYQILFGGLIAPKAWDEMDTDGNKEMSDDEQIRWAGRISSGLGATLDGKPLSFETPFRHFPSFQDFITGGATTLEAYIGFRFSSKMKIAPGQHRLKIDNTNYKDYIDAEVSNRIRFKGKAKGVGPPPRGGRQVEIDFTVEGGAEAVAPTAPAAQPPAGPQEAASAPAKPKEEEVKVSAPPKAPESAAPKEEAVSEQVEEQPPPPIQPPKQKGLSKRITAFTKEKLISLIKREKLGIGFILAALFISFLLGMVHALTPGHGKAIVAAYLVGSKGRMLDAVILGAVVTITHTGSVFILGLIALFATRYIRQEAIYPWLGFSSGLLIVIMGFYLIYRGLYYRFMYMFNPAFAEGQYVHRHGPFGKPHSHIVPHDHDHEDEHDHDHDHEHEDEHDHEHEHDEGRGTSFFSLLTMGIAGGIVPCPDAMIVLMIAIASRRIAAGLALIVAFSMGLAFTLIAIGVMMVLGVKFVVERAGAGRSTRIAHQLPILSGVFVVVLGMAIALQSLIQARVLIINI
jgi:nickel/cobalt exporter